MIRNAVVVATLSACAFLVACSSDEAAETGSEHDVSMRLIAYQPSNLEVSVGATVTWSQQDAGFHTVTSGTVRKDASGSVETKPDDRFASERLAKGETFAFTFEQAGAFPFFCEIHPATMTGRISVE